MNIEQEILGFTPDEQAVVLYTMTNAKGCSLKLINIGASIVAVTVPDRDGMLRDVVLGYKMFDAYIGDSAALGKSVGRYANRIAKGRFTLEGKEYRLAVNNGENHLHGGPTGFQNRVWTSRVETDRVVFAYHSEAGEENYPGELWVEVVYDWSDDNELEITYFAKGEETTIVNLTNHVYFNLNGEGSGDIHGHELRLNASRYLPVDETSIPVGDPVPVAGTPMDFTRFKPLGKDIDADFEQLRIGHGYDHCWVIDGWEPGKLCEAGALCSPQSGIRVDIRTTQPGIQVYTGNWLTGCGLNKSGKPHSNRDGVALECQNWPDSPNHPSFPSPVLKAGEVYEQHIVYKFDIIQK